MFEDDYVASLLGLEAGDVLEPLARVLGKPPERCTEQLHRLACGFFRERSRRQDGYPRLYVYEGYQAAGLDLLRNCEGEIGAQAKVMLEERFPDIRPIPQEPPTGFPAPDAGLGLTTVFTRASASPRIAETLAAGGIGRRGLASGVSPPGAAPRAPERDGTARCFLHRPLSSGNRRRRL